MSKTDLGLVVLNLGTLVWAVIGLTAQHVDPMSVALACTLVTTLVNGGVLIRRSRPPGPARAAAPVDELDARHILDLDERLERLERAHADASDAAKWRALVDSGQVSGPAAGGTDAEGRPERGHTRNGHA